MLKKTRKGEFGVNTGGGREEGVRWNNYVNSRGEGPQQSLGKSPSTYIIRD
jgi:hypothetical protein